MRKIHFILLLLIGSSLLSVHGQTALKFEIDNIFHLEGDEKWDYLYSDDDANRLYVSHGSMVQVVDESKGEVLGKITGLNGVHGIAIAPALNKGYISTGKDSSVTIFDTKTFQVITKMKVTGKGPDAILFDPFSQKVFVFNGKSNNATVIDAASNKILATISFTGNPEFSVSDGKGKVYVNIEDKSRIAVINATTCKVENVWPLSPGEEPTGLALDNETHRLFSVCANKLMVVVDAESGKVLTSLPTGEKTDGAAFDTGFKCAYASNGEGTLTVVKEENKDMFKVLTNIPTQKGAKTIAVNKKTHHIYLPAASFETAVGQEKPTIVKSSFVILDIEAE